MKASAPMAGLAGRAASGLRNVANATGSATEKPPPISIIVAVEIEEGRTAAFLEAMAVDAAGSREEPGCFTFDLLRDKSESQKFYFYEVYADENAMAVHKETPHYKAWAQFKAEGGVLSQTVIKADAIDFSF